MTFWRWLAPCLPLWVSTRSARNDGGHTIALTSGDGPISRLRTNAKVNLVLRVLGRRSDGYHEIETIFHSVGLADDLWIRATSSVGVELDMALEPGVRGPAPAPRDNLAARAAAELASFCGPRAGAEIRITKRIPMGAGMGGGSANAAGVLVALNRLWGLGRTNRELAELAARLGSDVPYCVTGGTALATSRGEVLTPLLAPERLWFVLGLASEPLGTGAVYAATSRFDAVAGAGPMVAALGAGDPARVGALLHNGLEPAIFALRPELEDAKGAVLRAGALGACLSGSGPTVFGLARDEAHAGDLAARLEGVFSRVVVASSRPGCVEPLDPPPEESSE